MDVDAWLRTATADAERRGLHELKALLEGLARSTRTLRQAYEEILARQEDPDR